MEMLVAVCPVDGSKGAALHTMWAAVRMVCGPMMTPEPLYCTPPIVSVIRQMALEGKGRNGAESGCSAEFGTARLASETFWLLSYSRPVTPPSDTVVVKSVTRYPP